MSAQTVRVRRAGPEDADDLVRMAAGLNAQHGDPTEPFDREAALRDAVGPEAAVEAFVAEAAGRLVGYAFLNHTIYESGYAVRGAYLSDLWGDADARGLGAGRALIAACAASVRARGGAYVSWTTAPDNDAARKFYDRIGASSEAVRAHYVFDEMFERLAASHGEEGEAPPSSVPGS